MSGDRLRLSVDEWERRAENARAARMKALDEALTAVRTQDEDVMEAEDLAALNAAQDVVNELRRTW